MPESEGRIFLDRQLRDIIRWILTEGREASSPGRFVNALCRRLVEAGVPL